MTASVRQKQSIARVLIALSLACAFATFAFAGFAGLMPSRVPAVIPAAGVGGFVAWLFWRHAILPFEEGAASRALKILSGVATVAALGQLLRLCVFIVHPGAAGYALGPMRGPGLAIAHSCVSAYFVAAQSAPTVPDVYSFDLYSRPFESPDAIRKPKQMGPFNIDAYEYPPPFLMLPRALAIVAPDFFRFRMIWFALSGSVALGGVLAVIRMLSPMGGTRALLLCPLIFVSDHMISTLQIGNLQAMVIALAMVAMVLLVRGRYLAGGLLLAYVTLSKMFPVLLLVYLLVKRQWRALAWTIGACAVLVAISVLDTGWTPYHAFLKQFPRLLGGEAFPAFRNPVSIAKNYSVPGMVFKLHLFGLPGTSFQVMKIVGSIYMLIDLAATVAFARQTRNRDEQPIVWLAILILASLRSPFLPSYAILPALWLLTLVAAGAELGAKRLWLVLVAWVMLNASVPMLNPDPRLTSAAVLISQAAIVVLVVLAFRHRREPRGRETLDATAVGTWNPALHRQASISDHIVGNLALGTRSAALPGRQEELDKVGMSPSTAAVAGAIAVSQTVHPSLMARSVHRANRLHR